MSAYNGDGKGEGSHSCTEAVEEGVVWLARHKVAVESHD
jgi:hypothetical protein